MKAWVKDWGKWPGRGQRLAALLFGAVCAYGAIRASFFFVTDYGLQTAWPVSHAFLLPLCLDALAATGFLVYGINQDPYSLKVGCGAVVVSAVFNAASHGFRGGYLEPTWPWFTAGAFVPAVCVVLILHVVFSRWLNPKPKKPREDADAAGDDPDAAVGESAGGDTSATGRGSVGNGAVRPGLLAVAADPPGKTSAAAPRPQKRVSTTRTPSAGDLERAQRVRDNGWQDELIETLATPEYLNVSYVPAQRARALARNGAGAQSE